MAEFNQVFARAEYYDIVFRRDVSREVDFLLGEYRRLNHREASSVLEIACGPGYHARLYAQRGLKTFGLDLRPEMIDFARREADSAGIKIDWLAADMRAFTLPTQVDAITTNYDSIDCLETSDDIIEHFRTVARNLTPGGVYMFDLAHPRDCNGGAYEPLLFCGERDGIAVRIEWAVNRPKPDPFTQVAEVETVLRIVEHGQEHVYVDWARERYTGPQEFLALIKMSGVMRFVGCYGDFVPGLIMDNGPASKRMIFVLQKPQINESL